MRAVFLGGLEEGYQILKAILEHPTYRAYIAGAVTSDDSAVGQISGYRSFDDLTNHFGVSLYKIRHVRDPDALKVLERLAPDLIIVVGWSQLLGAEALRLPRLGCIGLHTSLLPRHRGRAPIPWAIIKGLGRSGITLFYLTPGVDDGDIIDQRTFYITLHDTAQSVYGKAVQAGIELMLENLPLLAAGRAPRHPQDGRLADYWPRRRPEDGLIDWQRPALQIYDLIRGVTRPYPGAFTHHGGRKLIIWSAKLLPTEELDLDADPGVVLDLSPTDAGVVVGTTDGALLIDEVQLEGDVPSTAYAYAQATGLGRGERLGFGLHDHRGV
jgi:methionyl-tRNA formyltransferase